MTIEIGTLPPSPPPADQAAALRQMLFEAVRRGEGGAPLLKALLSDVKLSADQQLFVDMLIKEMDSPDETSAVVSEEDDRTVAFREELANLRQANDTMAAALGACPYCWGGDRYCRVCCGRGHPGYAPPDRDLFDELVMPAVHRVRANRRAGPVPGSRRARA